MEQRNGTRPGHKSAENVCWDIGFARDMFDGGILMLNIEFPLQDFA